MGKEERGRQEAPRTPQASEAGLLPHLPPPTLYGEAPKLTASSQSI